MLEEREGTQPMKFFLPWWRQTGKDARKRTNWFSKSHKNKHPLLVWGQSNWLTEDLFGFQAVRASSSYSSPPCLILLSEGSGEERGGMPTLCWAVSDGRQPPGGGGCGGGGANWSWSKSAAIDSSSDSQSLDRREVCLSRDPEGKDDSCLVRGCWS